jgi:hypothetical protein
MNRASDTPHEERGRAKWRSDRDPTRSDRGLAEPSDDRAETRHDRTETWLSQAMIGQSPDTIGQRPGWAKWRSDRDPTRSDRDLTEPSDDRTEPWHDRTETWLSQVTIGQMALTRGLGPRSLSTRPDKTQPANTGGGRTQIEVTRGKAWNSGTLWRCSVDKIRDEETLGDRAFGRHQHENSQENRGEPAPIKDWNTTP